MTHSIYLSGPISGVHPTIAQEWRNRFEKAMQTPDSSHVECINPMRFSKTTPMSEGDASYITARYRFDVQRADLLVVNFLYLPPQTVISIGSVIEMAWADAWRKPIILAAPLSNDTLLFSHPFIKEIVSTIVFTELELIYQARAFLSISDGLEPVSAELTPDDCPF